MPKNRTCFCALKGEAILFLLSPFLGNVKMLDLLSSQQGKILRIYLRHKKLKNPETNHQLGQGFR